MGHVTVVGGCRAKDPLTGILASTLPVGSTVKLMEGGTAVEYLVVNQGIPSNSNLYDASCDGTWLLRKDCHSVRAWDSNNVNKYESSTINTWLNGEFFNSFGIVEQSTIKQVKIPYHKNGGSGTTQPGANGLPCKIFLLSDRELGFLPGDSNIFMSNDGAKLDYFNENNEGDAKRIANYNGSPNKWWLRSIRLNVMDAALITETNGGWNASDASYPRGARPALVLPNTARFDKTSSLLKGVA